MTGPTGRRHGPRDTGGSSRGGVRSDDHERHRERKGRKPDRSNRRGSFDMPEKEERSKDSGSGMYLNKAALADNEDELMASKFLQHKEVSKPAKLTTMERLRREKQARREDKARRREMGQDVSETADTTADDYDEAEEEASSDSSNNSSSENII